MCPACNVISTSYLDILRAVDDFCSFIIPFSSWPLKYFISPFANNLNRRSYFMNHLFFFKRLPSSIGSPFFLAIEKRYSVGFISRDNESTYCITYKISLSYKTFLTSVVFDKSELKSIPSKKGWRISFFMSWPVIGQPRRSRGSSYKRASIKLTTIGSTSVGQSIFLDRI